MKLKQNNQANEGVSKFKMLSAYGGPGSLVHTQYGSIIISSIDEWGFLKRINEFNTEAIENRKNEEETIKYVSEQARLERNGSIDISNDSRFLNQLKERKSLENLKYLVLIPNIELKEISNKVPSFVENTITSVYFPKSFRNKKGTFRTYNSWFTKWNSDNRRIGNEDYKKLFFPPKEIIRTLDHTFYQPLIQDNIVLICSHGHISTFPWSKYLRWKSDGGFDPRGEGVDLFSIDECCKNPDIHITEAASNSSGFDGKYLKCNNERCGRSTSLKGLFSLKVKCKGEKPWEVITGNNQYYSGVELKDRREPPKEDCSKNMQVALTTANNLYYSRITSSIYLPNRLFKSDYEIELEKLQLEMNSLQEEMKTDYSDELMERIIITRGELKQLEDNPLIHNECSDNEDSKEIKYRHQEFSALTSKSIDDLNIDKEHLKVFDCTNSVYKNTFLTKIFKKILRVDNMKITSAQLDFSRVYPFDGDQLGTNERSVKPKNIFRCNPEEVISYPVVENYGEGIFFSFNESEIEQYAQNNKEYLAEWKNTFSLENPSDFEKNSIDKVKNDGWQLYLIHTFAHVIMRELEFRCGYPTASLKERIYVSNEEDTKMYGCLIYTAEGAEGSMGGLIAQTKGSNLIDLIRSAMIRSTICHSDPLCWGSEGQGLFNLNKAGCFSCALVSETSCEHRNIFLDRTLLVDEKYGFFKELIDQLI